MNIDIEKVAYNEYREEFREFMESLDIELRTFNSRFLNANILKKSDPLIAAKIGKRIIGICFVYKRYLLNYLLLCVRKDFWGKQIGTLLTKKAISESKKSGMSYVRLNVRKANIRAYKIYRKLGFRPIFRYAFYKDQKYSGLVMFLPITVYGWLFIFPTVLWYLFLTVCPEIVRKAITHLLRLLHILSKLKKYTRVDL